MELSDDEERPLPLSRSGRLLLAAATAIALMLASIHAGNATAGELASAPSYSGEELFEGLLLHNGPLADQEPDALLDPALAGMLGDEDADEILRLIEEEHPHAFEDFKTAITSNDPYRVRQGLYDGRDVLEDVLADTPASQGPVTPMVDTICTYTACAMSYVAVAFFIVTAVVWRPKANDAFGSAETPSQTLKLDEWVARIVQTVG